MTLVASIVAFALSAAGAVDGADIMTVADITQRHILGSGGAVRQAKDVHSGVKATPSSHPPVVGPVGANGTEVFFITFVSLKEERTDKSTQKSEYGTNIQTEYAQTLIYAEERQVVKSKNQQTEYKHRETQTPEMHTNTKRFPIIYTSMNIIIDYRQTSHSSKSYSGSTVCVTLHLEYKM